MGTLDLAQTVARPHQTMASKTLPKHEANEFGGAGGCIGVMLGLPFGIWALYVVCNDKFVLPLPFGPSGLVLPDFASYSLYSHEAMAVFVGWNLFLALLWAVVPARWVNGVVLSDGTQLKYKMNGFASLLIVAVMVVLAYTIDGGQGLCWLHDHQLQLATSSVLFAAVLSVYLYATARMNNDTLKAAPGSTGVTHYDFFMGHELNPRIGNFDLKTFFELRPGLIGWSVLNAAMAAKQYQNFGSVSVAMMLAFGDLAWVPFTYGLQARYLAHTNVELSAMHVVLILAVKLAGFVIFRGANGQKNTFRSDPSHPSVAHLRTMPTERGTKLMISGWWGMSRHINYLGDWIMSIGWCLPCGFGHIVPWFYCIYFAILLVHRERRDEACCIMKYGKDWDKYCAQVPYRIIPFVY